MVGEDAVGGSRVLNCCEGFLISGGRRRAAGGAGAETATTSSSSSNIIKRSTEFLFFLAGAADCVKLTLLKSSVRPNGSACSAVAMLS